MMELDFAALRADPERLEDVLDVVANLEADLRLRVDDKEIYAESSFPVAELAVALSQWFAVPPDGRPDFEFDSMSAEEQGLIWIRGVDDGWRIGSIHQERPALHVYSTAAIDQLVRDYVSTLHARIKEMFGPAVAANLTEAIRGAS